MRPAGNTIYSTEWAASGTPRTGTVLSFYGRFGFIETADDDRVFVPLDACPRPLRAGERVKFEVSRDQRGRGLRARNVKIIR